MEQSIIGNTTEILKKSLCDWAEISDRDWAPLTFLKEKNLFALC